MNFWQVWRLVSDELPEGDERVLFFDAGRGDIFVGELVELEDGRRYWVATNGNEGRAHEEVTHWMRLPDEPTEPAPGNVGFYIDAHTE